MPEATVFEVQPRNPNRKLVADKQNLVATSGLACRIDSTLHPSGDLFVWLTPRWREGVVQVAPRLGLAQDANADGNADYLLRYIVDGRDVTFLVGDPTWERSQFRQIGLGSVAAMRAAHPQGLRRITGCPGSSVASPTGRRRWC